MGFRRSHFIHLGWWSTGSPKLQLFQLSQHSHVTNCRLVSYWNYFPWNMTLKYKMQYQKVPEIETYILSRGHSVFRRKKYFFSGGLSLDALHQSSKSTFRDFFVKTTKRLQGKVNSPLEPFHTFHSILSGQCLQSNGESIPFVLKGRKTTDYRQ